MFGQKSISQPRVPASNIAARSSADAELKPLMLIILTGWHTGSGLLVLDGTAQSFLNTWMRLLGRSQTYTKPSFPSTTQCGWPLPVAPNVPGGQFWPMLGTGVPVGSLGGGNLQVVPHCPT